MNKRVLAGLNKTSPQPQSTPILNAAKPVVREMGVVDTGLTAIRLVLESRLQGLLAETQSINTQLKRLDSLKVGVPSMESTEVPHKATQTYAAGIPQNQAMPTSLPSTMESTEIVIPPNFTLEDS